MTMSKKSWLLLIFMILCSVIVFSQEIRVGLKPLNSSGEIVPYASYNYVFNFTDNENCSEPRLSYSRTVVTNRNGEAVISINVSSLPYTARYLCEYRNGTFKGNHNISSSIPKTVRTEYVYVEHSIFLNDSPVCTPKNGFCNQTSLGGGNTTQQILQTVNVSGAYYQIIASDLTCTNCIGSTEITTDVSGDCGASSVCGGGHEHSEYKGFSGNYSIFGNTTINVTNLLSYKLNNSIDCPSGNYSYGTYNNGTHKCRNDIDTDNIGLTYDSFAGNYTNFTRLILNISNIGNRLYNMTVDCPAGNYSYGTYNNGSLKCRNDIDTDNIGLTSDSFLGNYTNYQNIPNNVTSIGSRLYNSSIECPGGNYSYGAYSNGTLKCRSDIAGSLVGGSGNITGSGSTNYLGIWESTTSIIYNAWISIRNGFLQVNTGVNTTWIMLNGDNRTAWGTTTDSWLPNATLYDNRSTTSMLYQNVTTINNTYLKIVNFVNITHTSNLTNNNGWLSTDSFQGNYSIYQYIPLNITNIGNKLYNGSVDCPAGNYSYGTHNNGSLKCRSDIDNDNVGITSDSFLGNYSNYQYIPLNTSNIGNRLYNMTVDCPTGNYSYGTYSNGSLKCRSDTDNVGITSDSFLGNYTNYQNIPNNVTSIGSRLYNSSIECPAGNYSYGAHTNGTLKCRPTGIFEYNSSHWAFGG